MKRRILTFDFGASSGRAMIATYENGKIDLKEVHRFSNDTVTIGKPFTGTRSGCFLKLKKVSQRL